MATSVEETLALDATGQAAAVSGGDLSASELVRAAVARAEAVNPELNAIIHPRYERAAEEAQANPTGPLGGVPMVIKDLDGTDAGEPYHGGLRALAAAGYVPSQSSWLNARLRRAGAISLGRTNVPELGLLPTTEPELYGPSRNPWDLSRSPGGSSGGSAAAVAAGIVSLGHAGDGGGSIRAPASLCGLVGLKPSRGRISLGPEVGEAWGGMVSRLAVSRSVRDTALVLDVLAGAGPGDPYGPAEAPPGSYRELVAAADPGRLRVAWTVQPPDPNVAVDPDVAVATEEAASAMAALGHDVDHTDPEGWGSADEMAVLSEAFVNALGVWTAGELDRLAADAGIEIGPDGMEAGTATLAEIGRMQTAVGYYANLATFHGISRRMASWWESRELDVLITPTVPELPWELGQFATTPEDPLNGLLRAAGLVGFTVPFNITGQPGVSLPLGQSASGLPIGVQFIARPGREDVLLGLAAQLEAAHPWAARRPSL